MSRLREFWLGDADTAPLALFRILFGLQLLNWFWQLFPNLHAFFTDEGILPRDELATISADRLTALSLFGEWWQVAIVAALSCLVALLLAAGYRTRLMSLLAFVLVSSFSWRDPLILDGSDFVFRMVPFWLAFTPAGDRWSIDARLRGSSARRGWALPIRILELQIAWVYLATGLEKLGGITWTDGTAAYYALQLEHTFARSWARAIAIEPVLAHLISWYTLAIELAFLPLAMLPSRATRLAAAAGAAALQLGIVTLMNVGNFPVVMLSAGVLFLPPEWCDHVTRNIRRPPLLSDQFMHTDRPRAAPQRAPRRAAAVALVALALAAFSTAVPSWAEGLRPSGTLASALRMASIDQRWDMFSPNAAQSDGWLLAPATLADGATFDLLTGRGVDERSERYADPLYSRWTKVHERIASTGYAGYRSDYARYLCRTRNAHPESGQTPLAGLELYYVERTIQAPGKGPPLITHTRLLSQQC